LGGVLGGCLFILVSWTFSEVIGRLLGVASIGFAIGMMLAVVESVFRNAWLDVKYGPRETKTVLLGREPVTLGSDTARCTVYAPGALPIALTFVVKQGQIECKDHASGRSTIVQGGAQIAAGRATVYVRESKHNKRLEPNAARDTAATPAVAEWWKDYT
jgi:hypothetical protein